MRRVRNGKRFTDCGGESLKSIVNPKILLYTEVGIVQFDDAPTTRKPVGQEKNCGKEKICEKKYGILHHQSKAVIGKMTAFGGGDRDGLPEMEDEDGGEYSGKEAGI